MSGSNGKVFRGGTTSNAQTELVTSEMIAQAKVQGAKPPQTKPPQNGTKKQEETVLEENPIMTKLRQAMENARNKATAVKNREVQSTKVARAAAGNEEMVRSFLDMLQKIQELTIAKIVADGEETEATAREEVLGLTTDQQMDLLRGYAKDDSDVQEILEALNVINSEARTRDALYGAIYNWYLPLSEIGTMEALEEFLAKMAKAEMVTLSCGTKPSEEAVTIKAIDQPDKHYMPKPEKYEAVAGWTFCKEAETWAVKNWDAMSRLREQATPGLTPYLISKKGGAGNLFVPLSLHEAVLLEVKVQGGWTIVKCIDSVGLEGDSVPDGGEHRWDNNRKTVDRTRLSDAWNRVADAISDMAHEQYEISRQRLNAKEARFGPLIKGTTVGSHFEDQGLTRVLREDKNAVVAMWRFGHSWNNNEGFLGCRIRWQDGILVEEVSYDYPFPQQLVGTVMPVTIDPETLKVTLAPLPKKTDRQKAEYTAWKMMEVFLNSRLTQEARELEKTKDGQKKESPATTL